MPNRKINPVSIKVVGLILSEAYQRCKLFAQRLYKHHKKKFLQPSITGFLDMDWEDFIRKLRKDIGGKTWSAKSVLVFLNDSCLGGEEELFNHFRNFLYEGPSQETIKELAKKEYVQHLNKGNLIYVYFELSLGGDYMGTLLFQLRHDFLPKSCMWFTEFCTHDWFTYKGTKIQRVCKRGWFQSCDITNHNKWSQDTIDDENYCYKHDRRGILSFANEGKHTNRFQFFVTFEPAGWMDGKYVAFGRLVEGADVLRRIENTPCTYEKPDKDIVITNCGLAKVGLGRDIDPSLRLKGITVGEPHIHLEFFEEIIFERFDQMLFDRLDEEVKKIIGEQWIIELIWSKIMYEVSTKRPPVEDVLDVRETSSRELSVERYIAGLYGLSEIPDKFIRELIEEAIDRSIKMSGVKMIAASIVNFLMHRAYNEAINKTISKATVHSLVEEVSRIVYGEVQPEQLPLKESSSLLMTVKEVLSKIPSLKTSLSDLKKRVGVEERDGDYSKEQLSTKESVAAFVWGFLMEMLENIKGEEDLNDELNIPHTSISSYVVA
ncbi:probable inactive peptidyl-prolyl cis-trans isomerase-like 6 [Macrosteles quadrilineatus]|uniref:probable inactive peptidyl-prolyl cis-trans isomerase-like 6 n=1 Tax=Macrosteles quadrilineatus TaxID=74068 RepID=UPI0023E17E97|nr:probable inactive peptidyl-prolyl cis-trans isomerase-like 6 [Macrosteles quadrilineatus]